MLIARAPLRISFAGGGTDLPAYYERYGGMVVSTTIDKYVYAHIAPNGSGDAQITSADYQIFYRHHNGKPMDWNGDLALPRAVLHEFGVDGGTALFVASEVPPGTGLGSSSAVAVALVRAVTGYLGTPISRHQMAETACRVEIGKLGAPIGKQDQFAAAYGGLNAITFTKGEVTIEPLPVPPSTVQRLDRRLMLFFTGSARNSTDILKKQQQATAQGPGPTSEGLHRIKEAAMEVRRCLEAGDLDGVGQLLDKGWQEKRRLATGITNSRIDEIYEAALANGAGGGKITGAGGGGFLLLYCHEERQEQVAEALEGLGLRQMDFHFEREGVALASVAWGKELPGRFVAGVAADSA
ncbi:MAG: GHMP kinase [Dehalococcoidales bacterium]|nr:GHMP kinase [Dehalococcoidales bacterium]